MFSLFDDSLSDPSCSDDGDETVSQNKIEAREQILYAGHKSLGGAEEGRQDEESRGASRRPDALKQQIPEHGSSEQIEMEARTSDEEAREDLLHREVSKMCEVIKRELYLNLL